MKNKRDWNPLITLIKFQIKLFYDAARDFILSPLSIICILLDIILGNKIKKESLYYKLMLVGRDTDKWINLFDQIEKEKKIAPAKINEKDKETV